MRIRKIYFLNDYVVIGFCRGFCGEKLFLTSLKGMLKFWEDTRKKKYFPHVMVKFKCRFR